VEKKWNVEIMIEEGKMEDWTGGLCSVRAGHYFIMDRLRFFYEFQCSNSSTHCGSSPDPRHSVS